MVIRGHWISVWKDPDLILKMIVLSSWAMWWTDLPGFMNAKS
jgi:hypothetical protein